MNYLTPSALERLRRELSELLDSERPKVVQQVSAAAALGDRSENADYIYGKRRLREIDRRIHFLGKRLDGVEIIDPLKVDTSRVVFAAWVQVQSEEGIKIWYQVVGQDEIDPEQGKITFSSPMGCALLGKKVGDIVSFEKPNLGCVNFAEFEILAIVASAQRPKI